VLLQEAQQARKLILNSPNPQSILWIAVTGSRDWWDRRSVWTPLDRLRIRYDHLVVFNGMASQGLDHLVDEWAMGHEGDGVHQVPFPADWSRDGRRAGFLRNGQMIQAHPDRVLAWAKPCRKAKRSCPPGKHPSHGTADCVKQARDAAIPVSFCPTGMKW
jgi:hypothetical protein